jgi:hypothetical protein
MRFKLISATSKKIYMHLRNLIKRNNLLAFTVGVLIFGLLIPGCFSLTSNFSQSNNKVDHQVTLATGNTLPNSTSPLGIGLNGIADWSTELPFLDAFKSSRKWIPQCVSGDPDCNEQMDTHEYNLLNLDQNGWVKSLPTPEEPPKYTRVSTLLLREIPNFYPSGQYIVLYEGEGKIEYTFDAKKDDTASRPGRDVINVDAKGGGGILITITSTDPKKTGNYIRNIRVVKSEYEKSFDKEIFNPVFIDKIKKFRTLRFMDWMGTNNSEQKEWSNRPLPQTASYALKGAPIEIMVALSNKIKADPWFNMPHQATDEYITKFAQTVKERLDPNLKVYVEFSNEVWNWSFQQAQYALQQGKARWGQDKGDAFFQWYGMRAAQTCDSWKSVFGNQKNRVACVIGTQRGYKGLENYALECPYWVAEGNKPCYQHGIDAYAIAGYFSGGLGAPENSSTVESWLNEPDGGFGKALKQLKEGGLLGNFKDSLPDAYNEFQYHSDIAKKKGLKLVAYEGGQHITGAGGVENNEKLTKFFIELNRRPEMSDLYTQLLKDWQRAGGTLFMHFVDAGQPSKWGSWGALEYIDQKGSPKYNALMDFIDKNPCWWDGCVRNFKEVEQKSPRT